jgi:hypothetical protein
LYFENRFVNPPETSHSNSILPPPSFLDVPNAIRLRAAVKTILVVTDKTELHHLEIWLRQPSRRRLESRKATHVKISSPRQKRILSSLAQGDLIWEVPDESYFTQYNEGAGRSRRLRMVELLEMQESGWIRRICEGSNRRDHWELTDEGREVIAPVAKKTRTGQTKQHRRVVE